MKRQLVEMPLLLNTITLTKRQSMGKLVDPLTLEVVELPKFPKQRMHIKNNYLKTPTINPLIIIHIVWKSRKLL